jgi:hypothetical protein
MMATRVSRGAELIRISRFIVHDAHRLRGDSTRPRAPLNY